MFLAYLVASLGTPTNSGSTCEASNTQEESLPEVLLLMVGGGGSSALWSTKILLKWVVEGVVAVLSSAPFFCTFNRGQSGTRGQRTHLCTRWAPTSYKWSYNLYKWRYKWVTGVITLLIGGITPFITDRGPPCRPPN